MGDDFGDFGATFQATLQEAEEWGRRVALAPKVMKTFEESQKSKKTIASMIIERKGHDANKENVKDPKKIKKVESESATEISHYLGFFFRLGFSMCLIGLIFKNHLPDLVTLLIPIYQHN